MDNPTTFRELLQYVRTSGRAVQIRFAIVMTALALFAASLASGAAELIIRVFQ